MRGDRARLLDATEQIELIAAFSSSGQAVFLGDQLTQSAILHRLALLGEACKGISPALRECHPEIPWRQLIAFRNVVIHEYFGIDLYLVWAIVSEHVPELGRQLREIANSLHETD